MPIRTTSFQAIGTQWHIVVDGAASNTGWAALLHDLQLRIETFDAAYSRFRPDSLVTTISKQAGSYALPPDGYKMLKFYQQLYQATSGAVTPLIGRTMAEAGYDAAYTFTQSTMHQPPGWESVLTYDKSGITVQQPALLDFGAAGKGYLIDILADIIEETGVCTYTINAGGDIRHRSQHHELLEIGLENPGDITEAIGIAQLGNKSLCASAGSKRTWSGMHHIIDPHTLQSPKHIQATWVMAADTMTADGVATALFFTDATILRKQWSFSYAILDEDMVLKHSADFPVTLFEVA